MALLITYKFLEMGKSENLGVIYAKTPVAKGVSQMNYVIGLG